MAVMVGEMEYRGARLVKKRSVAPGEVELACVAVLQFLVTAALIFAPPRLLAGNGTALLLGLGGDHFLAAMRGAWSLVFFTAGMLCIRAIRYKTLQSRKWAWQTVIPLWACWLGGLMYPLVVGLQTNLIMLSVVTVLVLQWLVTRILVPLDSHWYSREVPVEVREEGLLRVDAHSRRGSD